MMSGEHRLLSIRDAFAHARSIRRISGTSSPHAPSFTRLMSAILYRSVDLVTMEDWLALYESTLPESKTFHPSVKWDDLVARVFEYLDKVSDRFDVIHPIHPLYGWPYQAASQSRPGDFKKKLSSGYGYPAAFKPESMAFTGSKDRELVYLSQGHDRFKSSSLSLADFAARVVEQQHFATNGRKTSLHTKAVTLDGVAAKVSISVPRTTTTLGSLVTVEGPSLASSLMMNTPPYVKFIANDGIAEDIVATARNMQANDIPFWERDFAPVGIQTISTPRGPAELYAFPRILNTHVVEDVNGEPRVTTVVECVGDSYEPRKGDEKDYTLITETDGMSARASLLGDKGDATGVKVATVGSIHNAWMPEWAALDVLLGLTDDELGRAPRNVSLAGDVVVSRRNKQIPTNFDIHVYTIRFGDKNGYINLIQSGTLRLNTALMIEQEVADSIKTRDKARLDDVIASVPGVRRVVRNAVKSGTKLIERFGFFDGKLRVVMTGCEISKGGSPEIPVKSDLVEVALKMAESEFLDWLVQYKVGDSAGEGMGLVEWERDWNIRLHRLAADLENLSVEGFSNQIFGSRVVGNFEFGYASARQEFMKYLPAINKRTGEADE